MESVLKKKYERTKRKVALLEQMIEDKTRELYLKHQKVQKSEEYLSRVLQSMTGGVIVTDRNFAITLVNSAAETLLAQTEEQLIGSPLSKVFSVRKLLAPFETKRMDELPSEQLEVVFEREVDGVQIPVECAFSTILEANGQIEAVVCMLQDISEKKALERQLLQAQKLESAGQLAAGIAHEINTPIQYVRDNTVFLQNEFENLKRLFDSMRECLMINGGTEDLQKYKTNIVKIMEDIDLDYLLGEIPVAIAQSLEGAESVARIVRSMKAFSHPGSDEKSLADLNKAIESTVTVSRNEWKYVADVELSPDPNLPLVRCFSGELNQVFLNLIVNAADAIGEATDGGKLGKGTISIETRCDEEKVLILFRDTGSGIPSHIREKVFNPFFTTKAVGKGTGQVLAIVHSTIVERHRGTVDLESEVGKGTTFSLELPLT